MKNVFLTLTVIFCIPCFVLAQSTEDMENNPKIQAQRVAFITQRLNLTPTESGYFWAIYNEYEAEVKTIKRSMRRRNTAPPANDDEAYELIIQRMDQEEQLLALKRAVFEDLRHHVSPRKLMRLPKAERDFRQTLVRQLRQRRQGERGNRRG